MLTPHMQSVQFTSIHKHACLVTTLQLHSAKHTHLPVTFPNKHYNRSHVLQQPHPQLHRIHTKKDSEGCWVQIWCFQSVISCLSSETGLLRAQNGKEPDWDYLTRNKDKTAQAS